MWTDYRPEQYSRLFYVLLETVHNHCLRKNINIVQEDGYGTLTQGKVEQCDGVRLVTNGYITTYTMPPHQNCQHALTQNIDKIDKIAKVPTALSNIDQIDYFWSSCLIALKWSLRQLYWTPKIS